MKTHAQLLEELSVNIVRIKEVFRELAMYDSFAIQLTKSDCGRLNSVTYHYLSKRPIGFMEPHYSDSKVPSFCGVMIVESP